MHGGEHAYILCVCICMCIYILYICTCSCSTRHSIVSFPDPTLEEGKGSGTLSHLLILLTWQFRILNYQSDSRHVIFHWLVQYLSRYAMSQHRAMLGHRYKHRLSRRLTGNVLSLATPNITCMLFWLGISDLNIIGHQDIKWLHYYTSIAKIMKRAQGMCSREFYRYDYLT